MPDRIVLEAPLDGDFGSVVRLIVGGIAAGADLGFEEMDDLQLAIERLYAESGGQERLTIGFELSPGRVRVRVGPLLERGLADALQREHVHGALTLARRAGHRRRLLRRGGGSRRQAVHPACEAGLHVSVPDTARARAREIDRELLRRLHEEGDESARERLVQRHLPLVRSLARRYAGRGSRSRTSSRWGRSA